MTEYHLSRMRIDPRSSYDERLAKVAIIYPWLKRIKDTDAYQYLIKAQDLNIALTPSKKRSHATAIRNLLIRHAYIYPNTHELASACFAVLASELDQIGIHTIRQDIISGAADLMLSERE